MKRTAKSDARPAAGQPPSKPLAVADLTITWQDGETTHTIHGPDLARLLYAESLLFCGPSDKDTKWRMEFAPNVLGERAMGIAELLRVVDFEAIAQDDSAAMAIIHSLKVLGARCIAAECDDDWSLAKRMRVEIQVPATAKAA